MKKTILKFVKKVAGASADRANGVASEFATYQPKAVAKPAKK